MKKQAITLQALVAAVVLCLPGHHASAQILNTFNSNFSTTSPDWSTASNWTLTEGTGSAPLATSDKAVVFGGSTTRNLTVNADGIHVGELEYVAGSGTATQRIEAIGTRTLQIDTLTKGGDYILVLRSIGLSVEVGHLNLNTNTIEIGSNAGALNGFKVTGNSTISSTLVFNGVKDRVAKDNRIELGNLNLTGGLIIGGRGNSTGTVVVSSLTGNGDIRVSNNTTHNGTAGTLEINSTSETSSTYSGQLRDYADVAAPAVLTLVKKGEGPQILSRGSGNTYTGTTTIEAGILAVTNTSGSGLGTGAVDIQNGGILAGSGIVAPGEGNSITVKAGGSIAPSAHLESGLATLTLNGANNGSAAILDMEDGSFFSLRFGAGDASDRIAFTGYHAGGLELAAGGISVNGLDVQEGTFEIFTFDSITNGELETLAGRLNAGSGFAGYDAIFSWNENSILLGVSVIPEPGLTSLLLAAALLLAGLRLRRRAVCG